MSRLMPQGSFRWRDGDKSRVIRSGRSHIPGPVAPRVRIKHGNAAGKPTKEYRAWSAMWTRTTNAKHRHFDRYGGRGIVVCEAWKDFAVFLADVGPSPSPKHSIDRVDVDGNYEPGNVRWATEAEQQRNRSTTRLSMDVAQSIRATRRQGVSFAAIASQFDVSKTLVRKIVAGTLWKEQP